MFVTRISLRIALLLFGQRKRICLWHLEKRQWDPYQGYLPCALCLAHKARRADLFSHARHRSVRFLLTEVAHLKFTEAVTKEKRIMARQRLALNHQHKPVIQSHNLPTGMPWNSIHD